MTLQEQLKEAENKVVEIKKQIDDLPKKYEVELWVNFITPKQGLLRELLGFHDWSYTKFPSIDRKVKITVEEIKEN
jgi:hypothetical protein